MKQFNKLPLIAFALASYSALSAVIIHFIRPDLSFSYHTLSQYMFGNQSIILQIGFYFFAVAEILIAITLLKKKKNARIGSLLLLFAGLGAMIIALFPSNIVAFNIGKEILRELLHYIGALIHFSLFPIALFFLYKKFPKNNMGKYSLFTGITALISFFITSFLFLSELALELNTFGLIAKTNIFWVFAWLLIISYKMINPKFFNLEMPNSRL